MSGQSHKAVHKMRRNASPQKSGPLKAVKPFILKTSGSPSSPVFNVAAWHKSPVAENRSSPDRSQNSPLLKVEKPKAMRLSPAAAAVAAAFTSTLRRTNSLDHLGPYLKGQWPVPVDIGGYHHSQQTEQFMLDKETQVLIIEILQDESEEVCAPSIQKHYDMLVASFKEACEKTQEDVYSDATSRRAEKKKKKHRRSASFGHVDTKFQLNSIRQKLQQTTKDQNPKQRSSPVAGNHKAWMQTAPAVLMQSHVHISKSTVPRNPRNSVEGLNIEIEKLVQLTIEDEIARSIDSIPDGHRAPVPERRSVDTQTPSGHSDERSSCSPASPHSISPSIPIIPGHVENSPRPFSTRDSPHDKADTGDNDDISYYNLKKTMSPKLNKIVREPPDGCEKVKAFDEDRNGKLPCIKEPLLFCPINNPGQFVLKQSISSAFCSLKMYTQASTSNTDH